MNTMGASARGCTRLSTARMSTHTHDADLSYPFVGSCIEPSELVKHRDRVVISRICRPCVADCRFGIVYNRALFFFNKAKPSFYKNLITNVTRNSITKDKAGVTSNQEAPTGVHRPTTGLYKTSLSHRPQQNKLII